MSTSNEEQQKYEINDLPAECLAGIIECLNWNNVFKMRLVCKKWYEAVEIVFIRPIKIRIETNRVCNGPIIIKLNQLSMFKNITTIVFEDAPFTDIFSENIIKLLKTNSKNLKEVTFNCDLTIECEKIFETIADSNNCPKFCKFVAYYGLSPSFEAILKKLQDKLEWFEVKGDNQELSTFEFQRLKTFRCSPIMHTGKSHESIFKQYPTIFQPQLINLRLEIPFKYVKIVTFLNQLSNLCPNIRSLELAFIDEGMKIDESISSTFDTIALKFPNLHTLGLESHFVKAQNKSVDENNFAICNILLKLSKIQRLKLELDAFEGLENLFDGNLFELIANSDSKNSVQILEISGIFEITPKQFSFLKYITYLRIAKFVNAKLICQSEDDARLVGCTIHECHHLEYLELCNLSDDDYEPGIINEYKQDINKRMFELNFNTPKQNYVFDDSSSSDYGHGDIYDDDNYECDGQDIYFLKDGFMQCRPYDPYDDYATYPNMDDDW